jgi:hypothetical protein
MHSTSVKYALETENEARKRVEPQIAPPSSVLLVLALLVLALLIGKAFSRPATEEYQYWVANWPF